MQKGEKTSTSQQEKKTHVPVIQSKEQSHELHQQTDVPDYTK